MKLSKAGAAAVSVTIFLAPEAFAGPQPVQITDKNSTHSAVVNSAGEITVDCTTGCSGGGGSGGNVTIAGPIGTGNASLGVLTTLDATDAAALQTILTNTTNINTNVQAPIPAGTNAIGSITNTAFGVTGALPAGTNVVGYTSADPCAQAAKSYADFESTSSGGSIVAATSAKKTYVCSVSIITSVAANVSIIEGTGSSVCTGGTPSGDFLNTGTTAANGAAFAANGGIQAGNGGSTVFANATANQNTCVAFTTAGTPQVNVHIAYVSQ